MLKRIAALLLILMLLPLAALAQTADTQPFYAYFKDARWMRQSPAPGTPTVDNVPERTLLKLTPVDDKYALTSYKGQEGYIYYKEYVAVDYTDPHSPEAVTVEGFFGAPVYMRRSPLKNAFTVALLPTDVRFQITFVTDEYAYLTYEGEEGYVYIADFVQMEYKRGETEPYVAYVTDPTPAFDTPYYGATQGAELQPFTPIMVDGFDGDHLTILYAGQRLYVEEVELLRLAEDMALTPFEAEISAKADVLEYPLDHAAVTDAFAKGAQVTVSAFNGDYVYASDGARAGYVPFKRLKSSKAVNEALKLLEKQQEMLEAKRFLEIAFSMLEAGNPVMAAFNQNAGGNAVARYQYGCPYLWAGMHESSLLKARHPSSNSNYYFTDKLYLGGFDCIGYARWVHNQAGMKKLPAISESRNQPKSTLVNVKNLPYDQWQSALKVGDCVNMNYKSGGYHVMIYIGTLRDFGFDENELGPLAAYMEHPLVIHCGMNNFHTAWYSQYLQENRLTSVLPPDGGVTVSILGVPFEQAPYSDTMWKGTKNKKTFYWFDLSGYNLTVINPTDAAISWFCVYRNAKK